MLTPRAWWFLCISLLVLLFGLTISSPSLTLVPLALLFWFGGEWLLFAVRVPLAVRRLRVVREVRDGRGPVVALWAGRTFEVVARLEGSGLLRLPYVALDDRPPFAVEYLGGPLAVDGPVGGADGLEIRYQVRCRGPGLARFEGVRVQVADFQGFFVHTAFVPGVAVYRVLPVLAEGRDPTPTLKHDNQLPPPGIHRLRRPGSSSELLDLRDYMPGDPPKTIAWKVSARRDRLITKVFESEAPVRCTLFVDASNSVRVPSVHGAALGRLVEIAAAVLQANADVRDLTGLCLFDEHDSKTLRPDRSPAHVTRVLQTLADAAALAPASAGADPDRLIPLAYAFAREVYPHLMRPGVNDAPFWQEWLDSFPGYTRRKFSLIHYLFRRKRAFLLPLTWAIPAALLLADVLFGCWFFAVEFSPNLVQLLTGRRRRFDRCPGAGASLLVRLTLTITDRHRRLARYRKQLAALLSARYGLGPGGLSALLEDDDAFALLAQRFLGEHHVPYTVALYDRDGRYLFASPGKVGVLASALLRAVGRGRDNELFVLLADLLELDDALDPLLKAVRVAVSRHHPGRGGRPVAVRHEAAEGGTGRRRPYRPAPRPPGSGDDAALSSRLPPHPPDLHPPRRAGGLRRRRGAGPADPRTHQPAARRGEETMTAEHPASTPLRSEPAVRGYTILCLTALMAMILALMENDRELMGILVLAVLGGLAVIAHWRIGPALLLLGLAVLEVDSPRLLIGRGTPRSPAWTTRRSWSPCCARPCWPTRRDTTACCRWSRRFSPSTTAGRRSVPTGATAEGGGRRTCRVRGRCRRWR